MLVLGGILGVSEPGECIIQNNTQDQEGFKAITNAFSGSIKGPNMEVLHAEPVMACR